MDAIRSIVIDGRIRYYCTGILNTCGRIVKAKGDICNSCRYSTQNVPNYDNDDMIYGMASTKSYNVTNTRQSSITSYAHQQHKRPDQSMIFTRINNMKNDIITPIPAKDSIQRLIEDAATAHNARVVERKDDNNNKLETVAKVKKNESVTLRGKTIQVSMINIDGISVSNKINRDFYDTIFMSPGREIRRTKKPRPEWVYWTVYMDCDGIYRIVDEIFTTSSGNRCIVDLSRKTLYDNRIAHFSSKLICSGLEGECKSDAKINGLCITCNNDDGGVGMRKRELANNTEGNVYKCSDGVRYRMVSGVNRRLCQGDNNECPSLRQVNMLCHAHLRGSMPRIRGAEKGDITKIGGIRRKHNGKQFVKLCIHNNNACERYVVNGGLCKKHSPVYCCKYEDCFKIKVNNTDYCTIHANGVLNKRILWKLETAIMEYLDGCDIIYTHGYYVQQKITTLRNAFIYDFYLPEYNTFIEADGRQHFSPIEHWGGVNEYVIRTQVDRFKDQYAILSEMNIIRLHHLDVKYLNAFLQAVLARITTNIDNGKNKIPLLYLSPSYEKTDVIQNCATYMLFNHIVENCNDYVDIEGTEDETIELCNDRS